MTDQELEALFSRLRHEGYCYLKALPDGKVAGIMRMLFTWGLFVGLTEHSYERRYCYERIDAAAKALAAWDGVGDPPGPWIKEKPSDRLGPGATGENDDR